MRNKNLINCLIGSLVLALLNSTFLSNAIFRMFQSGYAENRIGVFLIKMINILSFIGFILLIIFSLILIVINIISLFKNDSINK